MLNLDNQGRELQYILVTEPVALRIKLIPSTLKTKVKLFPVPCSAQSKTDLK